MNDIMDNFRENVRNMRQQKRITQDQLAVQIGVSGQMVRLYETSRRMPSIERLVKIADAFDVSLDELIGRQRPAVANSKLVDLLKDAGYEATDNDGSLRITTPRDVMFVNPSGEFEYVHCPAVVIDVADVKQFIVKCLNIAAAATVVAVTNKVANRIAKSGNLQSLQSLLQTAEPKFKSANGSLIFETNEISLFSAVDAPAPNDTAVADDEHSDQNPDQPDARPDEPPDARPDDQRDENSARR